MFPTLLGAASGLKSSSTTTIQKAKNKRTVLPKTSLIQLYLDTNYQQQHPTHGSSRARVLPRFNQQDILTQLNNTPFSSSSTLSTKKLIKDTTTTLSSQTSKRAHQTSCQLQAEYNNRPKRIGYESKESLIRHLAKEFFLDCKQRMDSVSYRKMLNILAANTANEVVMPFFSSKRDTRSQKILLNSIYELIKADKTLCNKFAAFLCVENALRFNLFNQTIQYEKCYEFLNKLELLVANKCAFKTLIQLIINTSTIITEQGKMSTKIDEIRNKLKSVTKNNQFLIYEFDYLFDQRFSNFEPVYETLSLVDKNETSNACGDGGLSVNEDENVVEFIDFTIKADVNSDNVLGAKCKSAKFVRSTSNNSAGNSGAPNKSTAKSTGKK
jgi:hypothetical protein